MAAKGHQRSLLSCSLVDYFRHLRLVGCRSFFGICSGMGVPLASLIFGSSYVIVGWEFRALGIIEVSCICTSLRQSHCLLLICLVCLGIIGLSLLSSFLLIVRICPGIFSVCICYIFPCLGCFTHRVSFFQLDVRFFLVIKLLGLHLVSNWCRSAAAAHSAHELGPVDAEDGDHASEP